MIALEWLVVTYRMPEWVLSRDFNPPTWLAAIVTTPFKAMVLALVLNTMSEKNSEHGSSSKPSSGLTWLRFELSRAVLLAAVVFSVFALLLGALPILRRQFLMAGMNVLYAPQNLQSWTTGTDIIFVPVYAAVSVIAPACYYLLAGYIIKSGKVDLVYIWQATRHNRLRLVVFFFLIAAALAGLRLMVTSGMTWMSNLLGSQSSWSWWETALQYFLAFPFDMISLAVPAVAVATVIDGLERAPPCRT
jgi:hypothetical protein